MCGIAGIIHFSGLSPEDRRCAAKFLALLRHRGPDGEGCYDDGIAHLTQTRLRLLGGLEKQLPLSTADQRFTLVYNGELYNFSDLRNELIFESSSGSDTEVVLHACARWRERALNRFNGMFSFFLWDSHEQRGFAAVDPLGIKPFFYHAGKGRFAFASEPGVLIESGLLPFSPRDEAIAEQLTAPYFSGARPVPFDGIERLRPGHWLEITPDGVRSTEYFRYAEHPLPGLGEDSLIQALAETVEQAVARCLLTDAPLGLFLSGGLDSSLIASCAARSLRRPLPAWTISYQDEQVARYEDSLTVKSADLPHAIHAAATTGCKHSIVRVEPVTYERALMETLQRNDCISAWEQEVSQHLLAEAAAKTVKAVLVGDAADETHFGYSFVLHPARVTSPRTLIEYFGAVPLRTSFLPNSIAHFTDLYQREAQQAGYSWDGLNNQRAAMSFLVRDRWLPRLLYNGDLHLMTHSLEGRVPFGDSQLLSLAQMIPVELGYRNEIEKWHLRRAAEGFLPRSLAWRPKSALTKNLRAHDVIHRLFSVMWREHGDSIARFVDCDAIDRIARGRPPQSDRESGLCFRVLAILQWLKRFGV